MLNARGVAARTAALATRAFATRSVLEVACFAQFAILASCVVRTIDTSASVVASPGTTVAIACFASWEVEETVGTTIARSAERSFTATALTCPFVARVVCRAARVTTAHYTRKLHRKT